MDCVHPFTVRRDDGHYIEVPCGSCILCRIRRTNEWSVRLQLENTCHKESTFLTLTYDDAYIPLSNCNVPTLCKDHLQNFFKRLRETVARQLHDTMPWLSMSECRKRSSLKYFACGEYGDRTQRCHFHAIIFGLSPSDVGLYQRCWSYGFVKAGSVSPQSINYVTGYVRKKLVKKSADPKDFSCPKRAPEFQIQSQGLGLRYFEKWRHLFDKGRVHINGHDESIPRYFLKKDNDLRLALKASEFVNDTRTENLKRAQEILNARGIDADIIAERLRSASARARTEESKNRLFKKSL